MRFFAILTSLSAAPVATLSILTLAGYAAPWAATCSIVAILAPAAIFALLWRRDLGLLTDAVRRMEADGAAPASDSRHDPTLMQPLHLALARLSRHLAAQTARTEQDRRADTLLLEQLPDPIVVLRADLSVSRRNRAADAIFGADLQAVLRHPALRDALDRAMAHGETRTVSLAIAAPVARDARVTVVPIDPPSRDGGRAMAVLVDRTREHGIERAHTDFVANVSHELRTPLTSLIGFTETLLGPAEDDPPARKRFLTIMAEQGARMNRLIDDLLSLSRIEMGEHETPSERVDLAALLPRIVAEYEPRLTGGARIEIGIASDLPSVIADSGQIAQILQNLLDNAVKYGKEGGIVSLAAFRPAADGGQWPSRPGVVLSVTDRGAGIPKPHLPRLTERFYRVDKGRSRAAGGTGLGLAIVKHIVNRHRGQLSIESEEGQGTAIGVWLPLTQPGARGESSG